MIREWFTARELADFCLNGIPKTIKGLHLKIEREDWVSQQRNAVGGGNEYHISNLPAAAQIELIQKLVGEKTISAMAETCRTFECLTPEFKTPASTADDLKNAKIIIVGLFDQFCATSGLLITKAEEPFLTYYRNQKAAKNYAFVPEWVFNAIPDFSIPSLRRWRKSCEKAALRELSGKYGNRKGSSILNRAEDGKVAHFIAATLVSQPQLRAGHIRDLVRANFGAMLRVKDQKSGTVSEVHLPKIRSFERHINEWKDTNAQIHMKLTNPDAYKNHHQMAIGSQSQVVTGLNHIWEIDASPVDALCIDGRYTLYAIVDVWSRRAMFMISKTPRTEASLQMIRRAIMAWGVPEIIKTDNGSDFKSKRFMTALLGLGITQKPCPPYTPEGKPHVERVIKTIQHQLMPILPGYVGHDVGERSQIEARKTFAQKLGVDDAEAFMVSMTHDSLFSMVSQWSEDKYNMAPHGSLNGMSPFAKAASWAGAIKKVNSERALDLLLAPIAGSDGFRTVTKKALRIDSRHYYGAGLELHVGERVMVRHDPEDFSKVYVFHEDGQFLCEAIDYEALPSEERSGLAAQAKANQKAAIKEPIIALRREAKAHDLTPETISKTILDMATADRANLVELPRPSVAYDTPALAAAEEAMDSATPRSSVFTLPQIQKTKPMSDDDRWWERRKGIVLAQLSKQEISETDKKWLEWYEGTGNFRSRQHFEEMRVGYEVEEDV